VSYALLSGVGRNFVFNTLNKIRGARSIAGRRNVFFYTPTPTDQYGISANLVCNVHSWLFLRSYNALDVKLTNHLSLNTEVKNECSYRPTYILSYDFLVCTATTSPTTAATGNCFLYRERFVVKQNIYANRPYLKYCWYDYGKSLHCKHLHQQWNQSILFCFYSQALNFLRPKGMNSVAQKEIRVFDMSTLNLVANSSIIFP